MITIVLNKIIKKEYIIVIKNHNGINNTIKNIKIYTTIKFNLIMYLHVKK